MHRLFGVILLVTVCAAAQDAGNGMALLKKAEDLARGAKNSRAEVVETSHMSGHGINLQNEIPIKIAAQTPLKMRREDSGGDQTLLVCDGAESFYSGDGHSYYRSPAKANPDCEFPLSSFYKLRDDPASVSIAGHDQVALTDGDHPVI